MQDQIDELRRRVEALEKAKTQEVGPTRCEPKDIGHGTVVYRSLTEPYRYFCSNCYGKGEQSILQQLPKAIAQPFFGGPGLKCTTCEWMAAGTLP